MGEHGHRGGDAGGEGGSEEGSAGDVVDDGRVDGHRVDEATEGTDKAAFRALGFKDAAHD